MRRPRDRGIATGAHRSWNLLAVLLLAACAGSPPHDTDPGGINGPPSFAAFEKADADHSGKLSAQETAALPWLAARFALIDTDRNGQLSWAETRSFGYAGSASGRPPR